MRFNPVISIILGFIIALVCSGFLKLVTGVSGYTIGVIGSLDGAFALMIGALVTTFFGKRKKDTIWNLLWNNFNNI
jgi:hypothetical protein